MNNTTIDPVGTVRVRDFNDSTFVVYVKTDSNKWTATYVDSVDSLGHPPFDAADDDALQGQLVYYRGDRHR